ncbi:uncharacterized protein TNCV_3073941 [Trichonephila clavipes]|nr:uncharacterized protein TNCV_3073941 [Trichonephila clavipes]
MRPHTITPAVGPIESGFVVKDALVETGLQRNGFRCSPVSSCVASLQTEASMGGRQDQHTNGWRDPKCHSTRHLRMVREDTGAPNEGATCAWKVADEAVSFMRAFLKMWRSSRRLVCRGRSEPGLRVNGIYRINWSQQLLKTQSERSN